MGETYRKITWDLLLCHQQEVRKCSWPPKQLPMKHPDTTPSQAASIAPPVKIHFLLCTDMHRLCAGYMHKLRQTKRKTHQMHNEKDRKTVYIHHCLFYSRNLSKRFVINWKEKKFVFYIGQDSLWDRFTNFNTKRTSSAHWVDYQFHIELLKREKIKSDMLIIY